MIGTPPNSTSGVLGADYAPDAIDRWRDIGPLKNARLYIDMKTFNDEHSEAVNIWVKQARDENSPHSVQQFELNCGARRMRMISSASYDDTGNLTSSHEGGGSWVAIVPDTLGETLYDGVCKRN